MKQEQIMVYNLTPERLGEIIKATLEPIIKESKGSQITQPQKEIMSRKETANFFGISLFCLHDWVKKEILTSYKVSGRTYFKRSELEKVLEKI